MEKHNAIVQQQIDTLFGLYEKYGHQEYGEGVTQLMHMVQAAKLARAEGYDEEVILAAFFHDIGHFLEEGEEMGIYGKHDHDRMGGDYLVAMGFSEKMGKLVASHVAAKRYLTFKIPGYYEELSDASKKTLEYQGGPMEAAEATIFENDPLFNLYLKVRYWDDLGKETDMVVDPKEVAWLKKMATDNLLQAHQK
jgi:putative nucleotidyltransferase with HDIG domain